MFTLIVIEKGASAGSFSLNQLKKLLCLKNEFDNETASSAYSKSHKEVPRRSMLGGILFFDIFEEMGEYEAKKVGRERATLAEALCL